MKKSSNVISLSEYRVDEFPVVERRDLMTPTSSAEELFSRVVRLPRSRGCNQLFFRVVVREDTLPEELIGEVLRIGDVQGAIHGVENEPGQEVLRAGDAVVIMLWGPGIAEVEKE